MQLPRTLTDVKQYLSGFGIAVLIAGVVLPIQALAAVSQPAAAARVSFTFDDGLASAYTKAAPTLAKYGLTGTDYVITGCVGMSTTPNTCHANTAASYMTWDQVTALQNTYGWEVGSHTASHPYLATSDAADGQPNVLTPAQVDQELSQSKASLASHGITATDFSTPYGDYNNSVLAAIAKYYASHRGFADVNTNVWPYNDYLINDYQVQAGVTVAQVKAKIDAAVTNKTWLVLTMHDIMDNPSSKPDDYQYSTANLDQIAAYVKSKQDAGLLKNVTIKQGLVTSDVNLLPNSTFDNGLSQGWSTDSPATVTKDTANNGSYPSSTNAMKLTSGATASHLFSPNVSVDSTKTYMLKSFLNVQAISSGEVGYYVDEYDANGNWVSGQWKDAENSAFVEEMNFTYKPTSASVKQARLQVYTTANSGATAYVDNFQWFALDGSGSTTPPATTDLMTNGAIDNGIADGWSSDSATAFAADHANNGSPENPTNSVKLAAPASGNAHLFSPKVSVDSTKSYSLKTYLSLKTISNSEVGFYVDEYDANGNWISGHYYSGQRTLTAGDFLVTYVPTSTAVKQASLQIILTGGSGVTGYLDNVRWLAPGTVVVPPPPTTTTVLSEDFVSGIANGWTTDGATSFTADATGKGGSEEPAHAVKLTATTANKHLFSPKVTVASGKSYTINSYLNLTSLTSGEVGYYVDEYDAAGNWISGKYLTGVRTTGSRTVSVSYTPTSSNVAKASLQVILTGNSGISGYFDSVRWTVPS